MNEICSGRIVLLDEDVQNLQKFLDLNDGSLSHYSKALKAEVEKAEIVPQSAMSKDVVTMHSAVTIFDDTEKETIECTVVYPWEADADKNKISVLAPLGTALLGYRKGDCIDWKVPAGTRRFIVQSVKQPDGTGSDKI